MVQFIKPQDVKIITKNGECQVSIALEITIKLDADKLSISNTKPEEKIKKEEESINWEIPNFSNVDKIKFGKEK